MKDSMGDRMKGYENVWRHVLPEHMPTIIRIDGRAFHNLTRGLSKPSYVFEDIMNCTTIQLCREISTVKMAYVQSDEISLLLHPYETFETQSFFKNNIQKIASVSASIATRSFILEVIKRDLLKDLIKNGSVSEKNDFTIILGKIDKVSFDSRVFAVPECEVVNYFLWRQNDATRNSIAMHAQQMFSPNQLNGKNKNQQIEMMEKKGFHWNKISTNLKRGRCAIRSNDSGLFSVGWRIDNEIPIFKDEGREYISKYLVHP